MILTKNSLLFPVCVGNIVMQEQWTLKLGSGRTQDYTGA